MKKLLLVVLLSVVLLVPAAGASAKDFMLNSLVNWMTGSFSSEKQAAADSAYQNIRLEMVPIWEDGDDEYWLYVEQAAAGATDRPYRQRVYRVTGVEQDLYMSEVFTLPNPEAHVGAWRAEDPLADLTPDDLELREGCTVFIRFGPGGFVGGTEGTGCSSELRGAAYATSEVVMNTFRIESWDRGFDENGKQVWGAEKGAYVFDRKKPVSEMTFLDLSGGEEAKDQFRGPGSGGCCYVYDDYVVVAWDSVAPERLAIVRARDTESAPEDADCTPDSLIGDFVVRNEWAEYFCGMWGDLLLIDSGTSNIRSLILYDVPTRSKVLEMGGVGGTDGWVDETTVRIWLLAGAEFPRSLCPDIPDMFGVGVDSLYSLDLKTFRLTPLGPWRCNQLQ